MKQIQAQALNQAQAPSASGYMLSSLELRAGLDVWAVPAGALPLDLLGELLRLQASWPPQNQEGAPGRPGAARP
jgi:hypothetical protein